MMRVLIADDHTLFRAGIRQLLDREPELEVVGEASSGTELLEIAKALSPDVILLDVEMPGPGAEETVHALRRDLPDAQVIILTMHDDATVVDRMLAAGADAYVSKGATREALLAAMREAARDGGQVLISVSRETMSRLREPSESVLSPRELQVLTAVSAGLGNAQIAARLFITEGTVKRHLTNIYVKLGVTTRMNAINKAIAMGLIEPKSVKRHPR